MMSDKDNNLLKSDILTVGSELSEKLNAIGVPNTFGKASEGKDNLMSIIRMTINGLDMTIDQIREILRDYYNKSEVNTLLNGKSDTSHNHDSAYANIFHNHDNAYASKSHQHDGADVILSNSNDVGTEIGNIEDDITSINGDITSLNNSITNNVNTIYTATVNCNSNLKFTSTAQIRYRRVGKIVTLRLWSTQASPTSTGWINIASIPTGYKPIEDVTIAMQIVNSTHIVQARTNNKNTVQCYVLSSGTEWVGLTATWFTNDNYPSP